MSSQTLPETTRDNRPPETAPSQQAIDEPKLARMAGLTGMMATVLGLTVVAFNEIYGPRIIGKGGGFLFIAVGVLGMLFHALADADYQIRRTYGTIGYLFLGLMIVLTLIKGVNFLTYGWACALAGLGFLLAFSRHETDPAWRQRIRWTLGGVGGAMSVVGFLCGITMDGFMLTYGSMLTMLGLIYLCAFISQQGPISDLGRQVGIALGMIAILVILYAALRSIAPSLFRINAPQFFVPTGLLLMLIGSIYGAVGLGIASDNRLVVMTRRELTSYFNSPIAYMVMFGMAFFGAAAYFFFVSFIRAGRIHVEPIVRIYFGDLPVFVIIFLVPAITMRLLAEEKRSGTYEVLLCAPVKESTVVLSKHFAALIFFMMLWSLWALYLIALRVEGGKEFDYRPMLSFYLALAFCGSAFISMGLFFSSLSKNQIIGAVLTFMGLLGLTILGLFVPQLESIGPLWKEVFRHLSFIELWNSSLKGRLHVREMILQGSFTFFWLFLTVKVLEARRWS